MNEMTSDDKRTGACSPGSAPSSCCQPGDAHMSSCCEPKNGSWSKGKALISAIVIVAAVVVGAHSFVRGTSAQSGNTGPTKSFLTSLSEQPVTAEGDKVKPSPQREEILFRPLDSLQALDTLAAEKDLALIVLLGEGQEPSQVITKQLKSALDKPLTSTRKVGAFTLGNNTPDYGYLVQHFGVKAFPCVVVLGRGCSASAVSGDLSEARLYEAIVSASKPAACCPVQGGASCCPK